MYKDNNPCRNCVPPKRNPNCHGECKEYLEWKKKLDDENKFIRKKIEIQNILYKK